MQVAREARRRSAGTKLTGEEYGRIERLAAQRGLTVGEWVRESLLAIARSEHPAASPIEQVLLAEVLALRTIVVNLVYELASGEAVSAERMGELIGKADGENGRRRVAGECRPLIQ
jgi:hypothetical protein